MGVKPNPRRRPATQADVNRAKLAAQCLRTTPDHLRELVWAEKDGRQRQKKKNNTAPMKLW